MLRNDRWFVEKELIELKESALYEAIDEGSSPETIEALLNSPRKQKLLEYRDLGGKTPEDLIWFHQHALARRLVVSNMPADEYYRMVRKLIKKYRR